MGNKKPVKKVASIALFRDGELLFGRRADSGLYTLPGGHIEEGETPAKACVRECVEECDLRPEDLEFLGEGTVERDDATVVIHCFKGLAGPGEPSSKNDPDKEVPDDCWAFVDVLEGLPEAIGEHLHAPQNIVLRLLGLQDGDLEVEMEGKLEKMAIADIPIGKQIQSNVPDREHLFDYSHLLPESMRDRYQIQVSVNRGYDPDDPSEPALESILRYKDPQTGLWKRQGAVTGLWAHKQDSGGEGIQPHSVVAGADHRGQGLGTAMYEALYVHAKKGLGINMVSGGSHTLPASRVHQKLSEKHGMDYSPDFLGEDGGGEYQYTIKSSMMKTQPSFKGFPKLDIYHRGEPQLVDEKQAETKARLMFEQERDIAPERRKEIAVAMAEDPDMGGAWTDKGTTGFVKHPRYLEPAPHGVDPWTSVMGTRPHESFHGLMAQVDKKYGTEARTQLVDQMVASLPEELATSLMQSHLVLSGHEDPDDPYFWEEVIASGLGYLNNTQDRMRARHYLSRKYGMDHGEIRQLDSNIKRAIKLLRQTAQYDVDHTWLPVQKSEPTYAPMQKSEFLRSRYPREQDETDTDWAVRMIQSEYDRLGARYHAINTAADKDEISRLIEHPTAAERKLALKMQGVTPAHLDFALRSTLLRETFSDEDTEKTRVRDIQRISAHPVADDAYFELLMSPHSPVWNEAWLRGLWTKSDLTALRNVAHIQTLASPEIAAKLNSRHLEYFAGHMASQWDMHGQILVRQHIQTNLNLVSKQFFEHPQLSAAAVDSFAKFKPGKLLASPWQARAVEHPLCSSEILTEHVSEELKRLDPNTPGRGLTMSTTPTEPYRAAIRNPNLPSSAITDVVGFIVDKFADPGGISPSTLGGLCTEELFHHPNFDLELRSSLHQTVVDHLNTRYPSYFSVTQNVVRYTPWSHDQTERILGNRKLPVWLGLDSSRLTTPDLVDKYMDLAVNYDPTDYERFPSLSHYFYNIGTNVWSAPALTQQHIDKMLDVSSSLINLDRYMGAGLVDMLHTTRDYFSEQNRGTSIAEFLDKVDDAQEEQNRWTPLERQKYERILNNSKLIEPKHMIRMMDDIAEGHTFATTFSVLASFNPLAVTDKVLDSLASEVVAPPPPITSDSWTPKVKGDRLDSILSTVEKVPGLSDTSKTSFIHKVAERISMPAKWSDRVSGTLHKMNVLQGSQYIAPETHDVLVHKLVPFVEKSLAATPSAAQTLPSENALKSISQRLHVVASTPNVSPSSLHSILGLTKVMRGHVHEDMFQFKSATRDGWMKLDGLVSAAISHPAMTDKDLDLYLHEAPPSAVAANPNHTPSQIQHVWGRLTGEWNDIATTLESLRSGAISSIDMEIEATSRVYDVLSDLLAVGSESEHIRPHQVVDMLQQNETTFLRALQEEFGDTDKISAALTPERLSKMDSRIVTHLGDMIVNSDMYRFDEYGHPVGPASGSSRPSTVFRAIISSPNFPVSKLHQYRDHPNQAIYEELVQPVLHDRDLDMTYKERAPVRFGTHKLRKIRDVILEKNPEGRKVHPKQLPPGDWSVGRLPSGEISADKIQEHIDNLPVTEYNISHSTWDGDQRHSAEESKVFQVNLTTAQREALQDAGVWETFKSMHEASKYSGHPVGEPYGIGWVRWTGSGSKPGEQSQLEIPRIDSHEYKEIVSDWIDQYGGEGSIQDYIQDAIDAMDEDDVPDEHIEEHVRTQLESLLDDSHYMYQVDHVTEILIPQIRSQYSLPVDQAERMDEARETLIADLMRANPNLDREGVLREFQEKIDTAIDEAVYNFAREQAEQDIFSEYEDSFRRYAPEELLENVREQHQEALEEQFDRITLWREDRIDVDQMTPELHWHLQEYINWQVARDNRQTPPPLSEEYLAMRASPGIFVDEVQSDFGQSFVRQAIAQAQQEGRTDIEDVASTAEQKWPTAHYEKIRDILFKDKHPNEVLKETFMEWTRQQGWEGTPITMPTAETKGKVSLREPDEPIPGHMLHTYKQVPKKMGFAPAVYGSLPTHSNKEWIEEGREIWQEQVRKYETDISVFLRDLRKMAVAPQSLRSVAKASDFEGAHLVDHTPDMQAHPTDMQGLVDAYRNQILESPYEVRPAKDRAASKHEGITPKKVFKSTKPLPLLGEIPLRAMIKPYHEKLNRHLTYQRFPIQGWAEMTNQALYHAADIGDLHQKVHVLEHNMDHGPEPALVIHMSDKASPSFLIPSGDVSSLTRSQCQKIALLDFVTNNLDRHAGNLMIDIDSMSPLAIDHGRSFQYIATPQHARNKARHHDSIEYTDSLREYIGRFPRSWAQPADVDRNFRGMSYDQQLSVLRHYQPTIEWWGQVSDRVRDTMQARLQGIKDERVRAHIWRNFNARANLLDDMARHGVENWGSDWHSTTVPVYKIHEKDDRGE